MLNIVIALLSNLVAVLIAQRFVVGFQVSQEPVAFGMVVVLLAIANFLILPMLRFIFKPFIWLTAGILALVLNGVVIYLVDFFSISLTISGLYPLLYTTIIFGIINALFALGMHAFKK